MEKREYVQFFHNQAVRLSLKFPEGVMKDWGYGMRVMYTVIEEGAEKVMFLDTDVAAKINLAEIQPGQDFWLCKRKGPGKGAKTRWDLYLEDPTPARDGMGIEETGLERAITGVGSIQRSSGRAGIRIGGSSACASVRPRLGPDSRYGAVSGAARKWKSRFRAARWPKPMREECNRRCASNRDECPPVREFMPRR